MAKRKYEQRLRAETAEETRRRVLDTLYERLRDVPAQPPSVDQIAQLARVSRSTIYLIFDSRAGLFDALATDVWQRGGFQRVLDAVAHPDAREHLRGGIRASCQVFAAHRGVVRALFSMSALDADSVGGTIARMEGRRTGGMAHLAQRLAEQEVLRTDVTVEEAAHLLWLLTGFDAFDELYSGRGLSADAVADLLISTAERSLCR